MILQLTKTAREEAGHTTEENSHCSSYVELHIKDRNANRQTKKKKKKTVAAVFLNKFLLRWQGSLNAF